MPATYRYRAPSLSNESLESSSSTDPVITDADDSIVLSDLVRTGEASRLRRRGAMRLEHGHGNHVGGSAIIPSPPAIAVAQPTWDDPIRVLGTEGEIDEGRMTQFTREARRSDADGDTHHVFGYTLFCGGETSSLEMDTGDTSPFEPSPLPAFPPLPGSSSDTSTRRSSRRSRVTNGCGALLHTHAGPRKRLGVWTAKSAATDVVIGMDSCYFDRAAVAKIVRSSCGCVREGVGCAVCGNPLGTRYKPCAIAADSLFNSPSTSAPPPRPHSGPLHPSGPRYWRQSSSSTAVASSVRRPSSLRHPSPSRISPYYVYTFFSHSVTPSPSYTFPATCGQPAPTSPAATPAPALGDISSENSSGGSTSVYGNVFDSVFSASPVPMALSEIGEEGAGAEAGNVDGLAVDRDGVPINDVDIATEPNSPDKSSSELMLAPER